MTIRYLILRSLWHYRATGILIILGIALATAILTGSFVVGDSVSGSIRETALARMGNTTHALFTRQFVSTRLADGAVKAGYKAAPIISMRGAVTEQESQRAIPRVNIHGVDGAFWEIFQVAEPALDGRNAIINAALARDLGITELGQSLTISIDKPGAFANDSLFTQRSREETLQTMRVRVTAILPDTGVGGYSLSPATEIPRNLFLSRERLASRLGKDGQCNTILVNAGSISSQAFDKAASVLQEVTTQNASLSDYGLNIVSRPGDNYFHIQSQEMVLPSWAEDTVKKAAPQAGVQASPSSVYLATSINNTSNGRSLAYAMIAGEKRPEISPTPIATNGIILNSWAAQDLGAKPGDRIILSYLVSGWDGVYNTKTLPLVVQGTTPLAGIAADHNLVPALQGITDAERIDNWAAPFPVDFNRVTDRDEAYWEAHRATPKAFINLETARKLWQTGPEGETAGWITSLIVSVPGADSVKEIEASLTGALMAQSAQGGLIFRPVRQQAISASAGTTDFSQLFLGLGMFLVAAAAGLAAMLMRLMADHRSAQAGIMLAVGFPQRATARAIMGEGLALTLAGTVIGVPAGMLYALAIIQLLSTQWQGAIGELALWPHITLHSLLLGAMSGFLVGALSIFWALRQLVKRPVLALLAGWQAQGVAFSRGARRWVPYALAVMLIVAGGLLILGSAKMLSPVETFFGSGSLLLVFGLTSVSQMLARTLAQQGASRSLFRLIIRCASANRGRSLLAVGLLASATFLVVTVAANTRDLSALNVRDPQSGAGGYNLIATADLAIPYDFGTAQGRSSLGFVTEDSIACRDIIVMPFLASLGEDISCLNLARTTAPRVLGVKTAMFQRGGFTVQTKNIPTNGNPWTLLTVAQPDGTIPVFGDADSVMWSLHKELGGTYQIPGPDGHPVTLRFVGLVKGSIFASALLMSEANFARVYPGVSGPRFFLITTPAGQDRIVADALHRTLGERGLQVRESREVLNGYLRVQNTYLSTFLVLGGLGVLLGTLGLMIVLLRNAMERKGEFALMLAMGFHQQTLFALLLWENLLLLVTGLTIGTLTALVAISPQLTSSEAHIHWSTLLAVLLGILMTGLLSSIIAPHLAPRGDLIQALREE